MSTPNIRYHMPRRSFIGLEQAMDEDHFISAYASGGDLVRFATATPTQGSTTAMAEMPSLRSALAMLSKEYQLQQDEYEKFYDKGNPMAEDPLDQFVLDGNGFSARKVGDLYVLEAKGTKDSIPLAAMRVKRFSEGYDALCNVLEANVRGGQ